MQNKEHSRTDHQDANFVDTRAATKTKLALGQLSVFSGGSYYIHRLNTLRPRQMGAILQMTFSNSFSWKRYILIQMPLRFVPECSIYNKPALVRIMVWCRTVPSSESMKTKFICVWFVCVSTHIHVCIWRLAPFYTSNNLIKSFNGRI